jgi:hypothetical protein
VLAIFVSLFLLDTIVTPFLLLFTFSFFAFLFLFSHTPIFLQSTHFAMANIRLITVMLFLIAGGLVMTASRFRSSSQQHDLIAFDLINLVNQEQTDLSSNPNGYNYCQAPRPSLETYPDPKVNM